jgi:Tol biopolymer transport system component
MGNRRWLPFAVAAVVAAGGLVPARAAATVATNPAAPAGPQLVDITASGTQPNDKTRGSKVSRDGRYVAFASQADNLVTNWRVNRGFDNVYLKDRLTGSIQLISHAIGGAADAQSGPVDVSADGRYVLFRSLATNLVSNDTNGFYDYFRWDRFTDINTLVSVDNTGTQSDWGAFGGSMSDDGRYVVFAMRFGPVNTAPYILPQVYLRDVWNHTTELVSANIDGDLNNGTNYSPAISGNGRFVAFASNATDLVDPPPSTSPARYIYMRDLMVGTTWLVSLPNGSGDDSRPTINEDGSVVAYDGNAGIWVWEMFSNSTVRADCGTAGWADGYSLHPVLNADGTVLAFESSATNLDPDGDANGEPDVFVADPQSCASTRRVSTAGRGCEPNGASYLDDLSADGTLVVFDSNATNLTYRDRTLREDIFVGPTRSHQPTEESNCKPVKD